ncbi:MAG: hypothetical protein ABSG31_09405 [Tepidisphaeraceae bacterium]
MSLHAQSAENLLIERATTVSISSNRSGSGTAGIGVAGLRAEAAFHRSASDGFQIFEKTAQTDEHLLLELEAFLAANDGLKQISSIRSVAELYASGGCAFVTGILRFRWAHTHNMDPVEDATKKQMVEFEVDRGSYDDGGCLALPIRLAGSIQKCVSRKNLHDGSLSPTSHLAVFLRALAGKTMPLGFFAQMQPLIDFIYLKPYAIWFP